MKRKSKTKDGLLGSGSAYVPPLPGVPVLELTDDSRLLIENHKGVIAYGDKQICVKLKYGSVSISGRNLSLSYMSRCQLTITGHIDAIMLERGSNR